MAVQDATGGAGPVRVDVVGEAGGRIAANIERVIDGKPETVRLAIVVLLAEGHLLIEDVPGVGKTKLARRWPGRWTARSAGSSSPPTCCRRT